MGGSHQTNLPGESTGRVSERHHGDMATTSWWTLQAIRWWTLQEPGMMLMGQEQSYDHETQGKVWSARGVCPCCTDLSGYMRRPLSMPGVYERKQARHVSKTRPKLSAQLSMPCWRMQLRRVLQMIRSVHCTITIATKNAVWHVYSSTLRSAYVCRRRRDGEGQLSVRSRGQISRHTVRAASTSTAADMARTSLQIKWSIIKGFFFKEILSESFEWMD